MGDALPFAAHLLLKGDLVAPGAAVVLEQAWEGERRTVGCAKRISGTDIADNSDTRGVIDTIEHYRNAAERRDAPGVLSLVSEKYFDDAGTPDPADDMDFEQLKRDLPEDYKRLVSLRLDLTIKKINVEGDNATAELFFDNHYRMNTKRGEVAKQDSDLHRMTFKKESGKWKVIAGL